MGTKNYRCADGSVNELRDCIARLNALLEAIDRGGAATGEIAVKAFELSQTLREQWLTADYRAKRRLLEIVGLNYRLDDVCLGVV